jgi:hypothetical protein
MTRKDGQQLSSIEMDIVMKEMIGTFGDAGVMICVGGDAQGTRVAHSMVIQQPDDLLIVIDNLLTSAFEAVKSKQGNRDADRFLPVLEALLAKWVELGHPLNPELFKAVRVLEQETH